MQDAAGVPNPKASLVNNMDCFSTEIGLLSRQCNLPLTSGSQVRRVGDFLFLGQGQFLYLPGGVVYQVDDIRGTKTT